MKLAIIDFDGTLFPYETIPYLVKNYPYSKWRSKGVYLRILPDLFAYKVLRTMSKEGFRHKAVRYYLDLFHGMEGDQVLDYFAMEAHRIVKLLDPQVLEEVQSLKEEGYHTLLLSGCFDPIIQVVGQACGFDQARGTIIPLETNHAYNSKEAYTIISGDEKLRAAKEAGWETTDWRHSIALADSHYDEPVLNLVGQPVAVNPDLALLKKAQASGWRVIFTEAGKRKKH